MKGVVLAGGQGTRLMPLTKVTNKHLLPVHDMPMIFYPIKKLVGAGIPDILVVTGTEHMGDFVNLLGSGRDFDCQFTYRVQDEAGGIAQALGLASSFADDQPIAVILGDNIFQDALGTFVQDYQENKYEGARIFLKEVSDPSRFGVAQVRDGKVVDVVEKPEVPESNYAVTGIYFYPPEIFDVIPTLKPSGRGELEITDVNNYFVRKGSMGHFVFEGYWTDAGTIPSLKTANELVAETAPAF